MKSDCSSLGRVHLVDKSLLLFMLVLLAQSVYSIFFPGGPNSSTGDIDIIVRTSAAAILGYFLSANFVLHTSAAGQQVTAEPEGNILKTGADSPAEIVGTPAESVVPDQAVFSRVAERQPAASSEEGNAVKTEAEPISTGQETATNCLQVAVAAGIGLFCLITLLVLRNLAQLDIVSMDSDSAVATVTQFRDFVSGCVGFLIGCPTHRNSSED